MHTACQRTCRRHAPPRVRAAHTLQQRTQALGRGADGCFALVAPRGGEQRRRQAGAAGLRAQVFTLRA